MVEVLVEHDYMAKEPNELTITKGEIIKEVIKKQGGWWEGTLNDKRGLFPDNFVKVIEKESVVLRNRKDASRIRQCRVVFSYKQDHEDELNLNVGDIIDILGEEEEGWWRGVLNGKEGVFPSNFVEEIVPVSSKLNTSKENLTSNATTTHEPAPPLFAKPPKVFCEVKFPYKAQNEDELTLKEGDVVTLISKDGQDPGWWKGELNGVIGVFPDNFVTLLPSTTTTEENQPKEERKPKAFIEPTPIKTTAINTQRKSLESTTNNEKVELETKTTPPLPAKKPNIPLKKSPSGSSSSGGIFYGLKKKIVDVVDGATGSKISPSKAEANETVVIADNVFDDVHRRPLLSDVRASRPKAPGRRPPSMVGRDSEPGLVNGNSEHPVEYASENLLSYNSPNDGDVTETKPKVREWAKHPAPWLEEMKLNQAKRSSNLPEKNKLTPNEKSDSDEKPKQIKKETSPIDKPQSITNLSTKVKTPTNDFSVIRNKPNVPIPSRPQTIQNMSSLTDVYSQKHTTPGKISPISHKTPSPIHKEVEHTEVEDNIPNKYIELEQRIAKLEELLEKQRQKHEAAIEELRGKLQIESEMRMKLQAKFEKVSLDGAIQQ